MKKLLLPLIFILLLVFTLTGYCDWLAGWDNRIKLTVDETKIDTADLIWFPVTLFLTATNGHEVFTELTSDSDYMKVAITKADGTTEMYAEPELFDVSESKGIYHLSKSDWVIDYDADTDFYLYFDKDHADNTDYIGAMGSRIDVGSPCIDGISSYTGNRTFIDLNNPADYTGKITNVAIWAQTSMASAKVATFYAVDATHYTARSASADLGAVTSGSIKNFAVNLDVTVGDFIGIYFTDNNDAIESTTGVLSVMYANGDQTACVNTSFDKVDNTTISLYATGATSAGIFVWNTGYKGVWHHSETSGQILDSTYKIGNTTTNLADPTTSGKIGNAWDFEHDNTDYATKATFGALNVDQLTLEMFYKPESFGDYYYNWSCGDTRGAGIGNGYHFRNAGSTHYHFQGLVAKASNSWVTITGGTVPAAGTWYYNTLTFDGTNLGLYIDGASDATAVALGAAVIFYNTGYPGWSINDPLPHSGNTYTADGIYDEIRVSNIKRTDGWIKATYNSLADTLLTYGSGEVLAVEGGNAIFLGINF
ncbi:MAG: LamG domain-containing protein [Candidatus Atribacteria bacterium]|nr:LamG domain-containing protein [Candidatus Atribacteria bacterium]